MNGCLRTRYTESVYLCQLDTPARQRECEFYEPAKDDWEYCRFNRGDDGLVTDRCRCIEAHLSRNP